MSNVEEAIRRYSNEAQVRTIGERPLKAAYILFHYRNGEEVFSKTLLAKYFGISRSQIEKALWKLLCGYASIGLHQPRYLAPVKEFILEDYIKQSHQDLTKDQIMKKLDSVADIHCPGS